MEVPSDISESVIDTSDTDSKSEYEYSNDEFEIGYDIQSLSSNENVPVSNDSSSDTESFSVVAGAIAAVACEATLEPCPTDGEYSENSSIAEIVVHRIDYNLCLRCKLRNDNPLFRYCKTCFQLRKSFLPPRPRGFKKKRGVKRKRSNRSLPELTNVDDIASVTSNTSSSDRIEKVSSSVYKKKANGELKTSTIVDPKELCIICNIESKNSIFLHGSTAHLCCCYKCAIKSWKHNKKCPACNEKAKNVVKVFVL